jgi:hypothetical protein
VSLATVSRRAPFRRYRPQHLRPPGTPSTALRWPTSVSANGRYIRDQLGNPWMMHGDTAWDLMVGVTFANAKVYLDDRASRGVNLVLCEAIEHQFATAAPANANGDSPFTGTAFQSSLNAAYWNHVDRVVDYAASVGITIMLAPTYMGSVGTEEGWDTEIAAASNAQMQAYGNAIAQRYMTRPNIIWVMGGDQGSGLDATELDRLDNTMVGIRAAGDTHLATAHTNRNHDAAEYFNSYTWLDLNSIYIADPNTVSISATGYNRATVRPTFLIEGKYQNFTGITLAQIRREQWQTILVGGLGGHIVGNEDIWSFGFNSGFGTDYDWNAHLTDASITHAMQIKALFDALGGTLWSGLAPDLTDTFLTSGESSGATQAAASFSTSLGLVYVATTGSITVDLTELSAFPYALLRWFDPTNGTYTPVGNFATSGSQVVSHPGANNAGDNDWVLVATQGQAPTVLGQATETDTAQPVTITELLTIGQATETDTAQPLSETKTIILNQATETDTSQPLTLTKSITLGQATETDTAQPVTVSKAVTLGQTTESDTAQPVTETRGAFTLGQAAETDSAQPLTISKSLALGQPSETDTAQPVTPSELATLGQATETDSATALTISKAFTLGQTTETDEAQPVSSTTATVLGQATETDEAQPVTITKLVTLGQTTETDEAQPVSTSTAVTHNIGQAEETDTAQPLTITKAFTLGQAQETDEANPVTEGGDLVVLGQASETDTAQPVSISKAPITLGQASETDSATPVLMSKAVTLGAATESDTAQPVSPSKATVTTGQAQESDLARQLTVVKTIAVGTATEVDEAQPVTIVKAALTIGLAEETDEARPLILPDQGPPPPSSTDIIFDILVSTPTDTILLDSDHTLYLNADMVQEIDLLE